MYSVIKRLNLDPELFYINFLVKLNPNQVSELVRVFEKDEHFN
jgi:hypothetical protein